jgi:hypothetical protein
MIVPGQRNLKVHYAAVEHIDQLVSATTAGVRYMLFTAFPLVCGTIGIKHILIDLGLPHDSIPSVIQQRSRHTIMDSGLFTLMFGSHKGQKSERLLDQWQTGLVELVNRTGYSGACVEVDCQKVLSPAHAWRYREQMRAALPTNRLINVFHIEDGQAGLDRLIEFSDYLALSIPELRLIKKKDHVRRVAHYIKNKKPEIDIHLLGCTEQKLLKQLSFCTSSDSSSWTACVRFGHIETPQGLVHIDRFKQSPMAQPYVERALLTAQALGVSPPNLSRTAALTFAAEQMLLKYRQCAGDQS